jgi:Na+-translocating ferredoxin:NAD+ oxidoreductase RnfG subunit
MKSIWINHKLKIILAIYVIVAAVFVRFVAIPLVENIKNKSDEIQEKIIDGQINQTRLSKVGQMEDDFNVYETKKESLNVILDTRDEVEFIKELEAMAQDTGNTISLDVQDNPASSPKATAAKKKDEGIIDKLSYKDYVSMEITLKGNYTGLVNFIQKLENFRYYVNIVSLSLNKETQTEDNTPSPAAPSSLGVFSPIISNPSAPQKIERKEKEILKSVLDVIIYTKK